MQKLFSLLLGLLFFTATIAQQKLMHGYLKDSMTQLPISGGTLINNSTRKNVRTDTQGFFRLEAAPDDVLYTKDFILLWL